MGAGVFDNATVDTNILIIRNETAPNLSVRALTITNDKPLSEFDKHALKCSHFTADSFAIITPEQAKLKAKIENKDKYKPLGECKDIKINYGIKTGLNDAFIIDAVKRTEILNNCADEDERTRTDAIIKPILRGRDIKRYRAESSLFLLATGFDIDIPTLYPSIFNWLKKFESQLKNRQDQGKNWWNLRACAYYPDFEKEKIIYPNMTLFLPFIYDTKRFFTNQKCFIITGKKLKFLVGVFNSKLSHYWIRGNCPELQGGTRELSKIFFEKIPIPANPPAQIQAKIESLVDEIMAQKSQNPNADTAKLENEIDNLVYILYDLTPDEIKIISGNDV